MVRVWFPAETWNFSMSYFSDKSWYPPASAHWVLWWKHMMCKANIHLHVMPQSNVTSTFLKCFLMMLPIGEITHLSWQIHELEWSTGGMILKGENWGTGSKICPHATLITTNPTWNGFRLNLVSLGEKLMTAWTIAQPTCLHSFVSNLSDDRSTASSKTIPPLNAI
jgi:hypothetical protein